MDTPIQENQHEFFADFVKPSEGKPEPRVPGVGRTQKPILFATTIEQILFTAIVAVLVLCAVYFLGILRGKSLVGRSDPQRVALPAPVIARMPEMARPAAVATPAVTIKPIPSTRTVTAVANAVYTIQIVTHKKRAFAENELAAMARAGFAGKIIESEGYFIVCVGRYASKEVAKKDLGFLKAKYADCFLRRL